MTPFRFRSFQSDLSVLKSHAPTALKNEVDRLVRTTLSETVGPVETRAPELRGRDLSWPDWINRNKKDLSDAIAVKYELRLF